MKKTFLLLWVSLCTFFTISAQDLKSSTLWKIDGKGLEQASYLFGTIHLTCDASLDDKIIIALEETDQLVMELDMDDPEMQMQMMEQMFMKNGEKSPDLLVRMIMSYSMNFYLKNWVWALHLLSK
jgi:uncharacterized protein YbaP (TraB family)